ncbi:MAG: malto-oligosyltrehalose synthase [Verrucomicrobiae bacterium]|nr:malto-oligosyltrehalose synthase [Verrucomicrobiae bacterium]
MATPPRCTYRLQFHAGFTLRDGLAVVPYLDALGVSHVYASPLLRARSGSLHGYDGCDPTRLNPELGSEGDLEALVEALRRRGMGLVLDLVPNHMAVGTPENRWWWEVLRDGRASRYAGYFDIDWEAAPGDGAGGRVMVPVLGGPVEAVLERGELAVDRSGPEPVLRYFEHVFPLNAGSMEGLEGLGEGPEGIGRLLARQHYRLADWRRGDAELNYRRFFNISHLAGLRVEVPEVFEATHGLVLEWWRRGWLDGFRIDHPDGLRDPRGYLERLAAAAPGAWIVVEKILEPGESLRADWPVAGTTGYDFLNRASGWFLDAAGERPLTEAYASFTGEGTDFPALVREKKRHVLGTVLEAEVTRLLRDLDRWVAGAGAGSAPEWKGWDRGRVRSALIEWIAHLPVYRTYVRADAGEVSREDEEAVAAAGCGAEGQRPDDGPFFRWLGEAVGLRWGAEVAAGRDWVMRLQQLTGPAMAKGVEDTAFYIFNRLVALNEVGGDPGHFGVGTEAFHAASGCVSREWPWTQNASATHDTKRGEDVRARLQLLSEDAAAWAEAVRGWSAMNDRHWRGARPDRNAEYLYYQTVVGAWPIGLERVWAYMEKAAREAKVHTTWTDPDAAYEAGLRGFVAGTLEDGAFAASVGRWVAERDEAAQVRSVAQTLLKVMAPGVPDVYQGTELWDFSLVDPDNRRPVDFERRREVLGALEGADVETVWAHRAHRAEGWPKLWTLRRGLEVRRRWAEVFAARGTYRALRPVGREADRVLAFARGEGVIAVVPRRGARRDEDWGDTRLGVPLGRWENRMTGETVEGGEVEVAALLRRFPVALLQRMEE